MRERYDTCSNCNQEEVQATYWHVTLYTEGDGEQPYALGVTIAKSAIEAVNILGRFLAREMDYPFSGGYAVRTDTRPGMSPNVLFWRWENDADG